MNRKTKGKLSYHAGDAAELSVARDYERRGYQLAHRRWRGSGGEIDLILNHGETVVFVEVKKSRSFARAASHVSAAQQQRIAAAAEEYLAGHPRGLLADCRVDVALVDERAHVHVIENAFGQ